MKPKKLIIEGLNSFVEKQEIDFNQLTQRGLFGIFGSTGSGKSTILDAIILALYGEIPRNSRDFINTNCKGASVYYEFEIGIGTSRKTYSVFRSINRDNKGSYKVKNCRLTEIDGESENVIADSVREVKSKIIEIVSLTSDDFTRCVVLPQGKFSEFLKLSGVDRRNMLERIFGLEKYGKQLGDKIKSAKNANNNKLTGVKSNLKLYNDRGINEEQYNEFNNMLKEMQENEKEYRSQKKYLDKKYEAEKVLWDIKAQLDNYKKGYEEAMSHKEYIDGLKRKWDESYRVSRVKPFIDKLQETENNISKINKGIEDTEEQLKIFKAALELSENEYNEADKRKTNELPGLISMEEKLNRAKEIENKKKEAEKERQIYVDEFIKIKSSIDENTARSKNINESIELISKKMDELNKIIQENIVSSQYRSDAINGLTMENELARLIKDKESNINEAKTLEKSIQGRNNDLKEKKKALLNIAVLLDGHNSQHEAIEKDKSKYNDEVLIQYNNEKIAIENKISVIKDSIEKLKPLITKRDILKNDNEDVTKELEELNIKKISCDKIRKSCEEEAIEARKENMAFLLAEKLNDGEPCPVCGSIHHINLAVSNGVDVEAIEKRLRQLENESKSISDDIMRKEIEAGKIQSQIDSIQSDINEAEKAINESESIDDMKLKLKDINLLIQSFKDDKADIQKRLDEKLRIIDEEKTKKNNIEKDISNIEMGIKIDNSNLYNRNEKISLLNEKIDKLQKQIVELKSLTGIDSFAKENENLNKKDSIYESNNKKYKDMDIKLKTLTETKKDIDDKNNSLESEMARVTESGRQVKKNIDEMQDEITKYTQGRDLSSYIEEIKIKKNEVIEDEKTKREKRDSDRKNYNKLNEDMVSLSTNKNTLTNVKESYIKEVEKALKDNNLTREQYDTLPCLNEETMAIMKKETDEFDKNINELEIRIKSSEEKLNGTEMDEKKWNDLLEKRDDISKSLDECMRNKGSLEEKVESMKCDLEELKNLNNKCKELEIMDSRLQELNKLIEGNKFVEFVAKRHLKYICMEASRRLKDISSGRYALEIDDSGNFVMRDDFNGGSRRTTSTLSGGETFLTSLSLALALSSKIQLKGSAPLEFFFLDEGFGTLDSELLNTVMDSLDRLHSKRLSVGIISHVEELKDRVPIKLIVNGSTQDGKGSTVKIELS